MWTKKKKKRKAKKRKNLGDDDNNDDRKTRETETKIMDFSLLKKYCRTHAEIRVVGKKKNEW